MHGHIVLKQRMAGAPLISIEMSERKAYTSALLRMRTAELALWSSPGNLSTPLPRPPEAGMWLLEPEYRCALGGEFVAGVGVSGGLLNKMS